MMFLGSSKELNPSQGYDEVGLDKRMAKARKYLI